MSELAERWLSFARDDLRVAELVLDACIYHHALPGTLPDGLPERAEAEKAIVLARAVLNCAASKLGFGRLA